MKIQWKSKIGRKIFFRIIIIGSLTFVITLILSYFTLLPPLKERAITTAQNGNSQIIQQTDYLLSYIQDYEKTIASSPEFNSSLMRYYNNPTNQNYQLVCLSLNNIASLRINVRCIIVETQDGKKFDSISQIDQSDFDLLESNWYEPIRINENAGGFSSIYQVNLNGNQIYTAAYSKNLYSPARPIIITIFFKAADIINTTRDLAGSNLDQYVWLDSNNVPFYSSGSETWLNSILPTLKNVPISNGSFVGVGGYNFVNTSSSTGWKIVSFVSDSTLMKTFVGYFINIILMIVLLFGLTMVILTPLIMRITDPINRLASIMSEVAGGNLDIESNVDTNDEIGELSKVFNNMITDLKKHIIKLLEKEELEQHMKYSLLISQIDPHFIYNTMYSINYLARNDRCQDIIAVNSALIKILQDRLRVKNIEVMDTVEQEIEIVKQYLLIQSYRYENTVKIVWDVDESLNNVQIPKNIIQPLVENSLFHGLIDQENGQISGVIKISIHMVENNITIKVSDNGRGIESDKLKKLNIPNKPFEPESRGKNIGIDNIKERLYCLYGNCNCMKIYSIQSEGTIVSIVLTLKK